MWLPEGYELIDAYEHVTPRSTTITAEFWCNMDHLIYSVQIYTDTPTSAITEKDETVVDIYVINGQVHYIFSNNGNKVAEWTVNNNVLSIYGPISTEEMKQIIASFYEGN